MVRMTTRFPGAGLPGSRSNAAGNPVFFSLPANFLDGIEGHARNASRLFIGDGPTWGHWPARHGLDPGRRAWKNPPGSGKSRDFMALETGRREIRRMMPWGASDFLSRIKYALCSNFLLHLFAEKGRFGSADFFLAGTIDLTFCGGNGDLLL